jgi:tetratricopeptide (TPR) repeat protein
MPVVIHHIQTALRLKRPSKMGTKMFVSYFRTRVICLLGIVLCLALLSSFALAHEGLHEQILAVTAKIKRDPKNASLYLQRGELHRLHRDWSRASADYDRAARLRPDFKIVDLARGKMLFESGRFQRARFTLDRFLSQQPDHYEGLITRARVLARIGFHSDAIEGFTRALAKSTVPDPDLYIERAQVTAGDEKRIDEALNGLDEGIRKLGPLVTLQLTAIELELLRHNYDAALTRLDQVTAQSERKESWLVRRGEILKLANRPEEARAAFNAALVAIEALPPARRQSRAVTTLQLRARSALESQ